MKRDARIGMAVVLVLGLSVTLLAGRALYKRGGGTGELEGEVADTTNSGSEKPAEALTFRPRPHVGGVGGSEFETLPDAGLTRPTQPQQATPQTPLPPMSPVAQDNPRVDADHESTPPATPETRIANRAENSAPRRESAQQIPSPQANEFFAYTVTANDNPWKISSKVYGDGKYTQKIVDANGGMDALKTKLKSGSVIKIPQLPNKQNLLTLPAYADAKPTRAERAQANTTANANPATPVANPKGKMYKVERGDTLSGIAKKTYGSNSPKTLAMIVAANKGLDANTVKVGQEIVLPEKK